MYSELASTFVYVKGIAEILHTSYIRNNRLFLVHLEEELPLYELGYGRFHTLRSPLGLAEYHRIIGIAYKGVTSTSEFLVQLVQHDVAEKWAQRSSLWGAFLACMP